MIRFLNVHKVILAFKKEQDLHDRKRHDGQDDVLFCIPTFTIFIMSIMPLAILHILFLWFIHTNQI